MAVRKRNAILFLVKKRLFIAINFPEEIKGEIYRWQRKIWDLPVRWTPKENIHATLYFLGWIREEGIPELQEALKKAAAEHDEFAFRLRDITYGPPEGPKRMIWLNGEVTDALRSLAAEMKNAVSHLSFAQEIHQESREFRVHITLARFQQKEWRIKIGRRLPEIETPFEKEIQVGHIDLMESKLSRSGPKYEILASFPLMNG